MSIDLQIRLFENKLISIINEEQLPIEIKRLVVKDIFTQVDIEAANILTKELKGQENAENVYTDKLEELPKHIDTGE